MYPVDNKHNAFVYDVGSAMTRMGYAGAALPEIKMPSKVRLDIIDDESKCFFDTTTSNPNSTATQVIPFVDENYSIVDISYFQEMMEWSYQHIAADPQKTSVVFSEPEHIKPLHGSQYSWQKQITECAIEAIDHGSICITPDVVLSAYAFCVHTGLVVDFGWSCTRSIPVVEGKPVRAAIRTYPLGGYAVTQQLVELLASKNIDITEEEAQEMFMDGVHFGYFGEDKYNMYKLRDGRTLNITGEMNIFAEVMWQPIENTEGEIEFQPIQEIIKESILASPLESQKHLWNTIIPSGGFSKTQGFPDELERRMQEVCPENYKAKVCYPMHSLSAGSLTTWTGGSILASSNMYPNFCITSDEWREYGESILKITFDNHI